MDNHMAAKRQNCIIIYIDMKNILKFSTINYLQTY